ncbi:MAG: hypothetical protein ABR582_01935 [Gemmatimonadaceae bacterium]
MTTADDAPAKAMRHRVTSLFRRIKWSRVAAELALIVAGVLVALGINNWYARRQVHQAEIEMLRELRRALATDLGSLRQAVTDAERRESHIKALQSHLMQHGPYADTLQSSFGAVIGILELHLDRAPYEALKARGLDLVSDDSLRTELIKLYDNVYADLEQSESDDRNVTFEVVRPYFLKAFRNIRFRESATPLNYAAVVDDPYFLNVVDYRLTSLRVNTLGPVRTAIASVERLVAQIDRELRAKGG